MNWIGLWEGKTVACLASGPSLTAGDCESVRGLTTIAVNTTFRMAPWADVLMAYDVNWWRHYGKEAAAMFHGKQFGVSRGVQFYGAESLYGQSWFRPFMNSGACAISLAVAAKAKIVVLLGYDCQKKDGKTHWHGDHPAKLSNAMTMDEWPKLFRKVADYACSNGVRVVNCTSQTALTCFERADLAELLHS